MKASTQRERAICLATCFSCMFLMANQSCGPGPTGPGSVPPVSTYLPSLPGYQSQPFTGSVKDTLGVLGIGVGVIGSILIDRLDGVAECLSERGVLDIQLYVNSSDPIDLGIIGVLNRSRIGGTIVPCTFEGFFTRGGRSVDPCASTGSFEVEGDTILYGYTGVTLGFCTAVGAHFDRL